MFFACVNRNYERGGIEEDRTIRKFRTEVSRKVERQVDYYNLDVIKSCKDILTSNVISGFQF